MLYAGGSFGRRANRRWTTCREARSPSSRPSRAPGHRSSWCGCARTTRGRLLPADLPAPPARRARRGGHAVAWQQRLVGQSIAGFAVRGLLIKDGIDMLSVEGASTLPYAIPNLQVDLHTPMPTSRCRCCGGVRSVRPTPPFRPKCSSTNWPAPPARTRWPTASLLEKHPRHRPCCAGRRQGRLGHAAGQGQGRASARPRRGRA
jgi:isoquinoline 1-oxidoreductase beta subunit